LEDFEPVGMGQQTVTLQLTANFFDDTIAQENFDLHFLDQVIALGSQ
jgi:hypothetical protein